MWSGWVAHHFHLKRADMLDVTLRDFVSMNEATRE